MWCDFWNHWVQMKCRLSHQLTHINMFFYFFCPVRRFVFALSSESGETAVAPGCMCFCVLPLLWVSLCVCSASWSQIPGEAFVDFTSLRLLVWVFSGGGVWVSISPGSLRQLRGSVSGCGRRLRGSLFQLSACYCATICGEWKGARPQLGYSSKGDSWDKVRGEMCKCASMCERGVRMTTHRHTPLVLPSVRKWDARLWESRARHFSFYVWWGERSEEETVNGVIVTPAAFPRLFRVSE